MKLSMLIETLTALQDAGRKFGDSDPDVFVSSEDAESYESLAEVRCLTPVNMMGTPGAIDCVHLVPRGVGEFWPGMAQFHVRADGSTRSVIPSMDRDVVKATRRGA